jgi:hypothetical protein
MSFTVERLDDQILYITLNTDFRSGAEMVGMLGEVISLLDDCSCATDLIFNVDQATFTLDDIIHATNLARRDDISLYRHPKVGKQMVVSTSKIIQMSAKGMNSASFGHLKLPVFATLEEALEYARQHSPDP